MIAIIGGGAAGMAAAVEARLLGADVVLLEKNDRVGKKLAATGNGRCNLTNTLVSPEFYDCKDDASLLSMLKGFPPDAVREFFAGLGLPTKEEDCGRVYPACGLASAVVDVLRLALCERGVVLRTGTRVKSANRRGHGFELATDDGEVFSCDALIIACGGLAAKQLGGGSSGYDLLRCFGHKILPLLPALSPVVTDPEAVRALKGLRARASITLLSGKNALFFESGELQFNDFGLSGIPVLNASLAAARELSKGRKIVASIDLLPDLDASELQAELFKRRGAFPNRDMTVFLAGLLHRRIAEHAAKRAGISIGSFCGTLDDAALLALCSAIKRFDLPVRSVKQYDAAQVTAGGARLSEFDPDTMESRLVRGLYAAGEVLDVTGNCGGFNLHFAWATGISAGRAAAQARH